MSDQKTFYLTTTLPYVNADPHIGFALEIVQADIIARYKKLTGYEVFFNTGTDEHGQKIWQKAKEAAQDPQTYADEYAAKFKKLIPALGLDVGVLHFIRTTDPHHKAAAQEFWRLCAESGDIYKKNYKIKYCIGCELEKTDSELVEGRCPIHPTLEIQIIEEENYFFRASKYRAKLAELYQKHPHFVIPVSRMVEAVFIAELLEDFSVSRLASKMPWGVPVPGDDGHVMYVWFDALVNYVSAIGWPEHQTEFKKWWPVTQFAGKDQVRQQAVMWQAMLLSAGLPPSKNIVIHGFVVSGGQKMSKSIGNVVDPFAIIEEYGTDALRYYLARHISSFEDSDFTMEKFKEAYNGNLANGLGNLVARVMTLAEKYLEKGTRPEVAGFPKEYTEAFDKFEINRAIDFIWGKIQTLDQKITETEPFKLIKSDLEKGKKLIFELTQELYLIGRMLNPFLPETNKEIKEAIIANKKPENLFPRKE